MNGERPILQEPGLEPAPDPPIAQNSFEANPDFPLTAYLLETFATHLSTPLRNGVLWCQRIESPSGYCDFRLPYNLSSQNIRGVKGLPEDPLNVAGCCPCMVAFLA